MIHSVKDFVDKKIAESFRKHDLKAMQSDVPLSNYEELTFASDGHIEYSHTVKLKISLSDGSNDSELSNTISNSLTVIVELFKGMRQNVTDTMIKNFLQN